MLNPAKMNTLPPKPCLVVNGEMPPDISKKHGLEVKDFDPSVLLSSIESSTMFAHQHD